MDPVAELVAAVREVVGAARELWGPNKPAMVAKLCDALDTYDAANPAATSAPNAGGASS